MSDWVTLASVQAVVSLPGLVIAGVIAYRASVTTAKRTIAATRDDTRTVLEAERGHRLWERRADVYAEVIGYAQHRAVMRRINLELARGADFREEGLAALREMYKPDRQWHEMVGRLIAFAEESIYVRHVGAEVADQTSGRRVDECYKALVRAAQLPATASAAEREAAAEAAGTAVAVLEDAIKEANARDEILVESIRADLRAAAVPSTIVPRPRRWWSRRGVADAQPTP